MRLNRSEGSEYSGDLAILGGGPAGASAAIEAQRRGLRVAIWERDRFPRDKVCGEFLSWESLALLRRDIPGTLARAAVIRNTEFISKRGRVYAFPLPHPACGLSRIALDEALWVTAARSGAEIHAGEAVRSVRRTYGERGTEATWTIQGDRSRGGNVTTARALLVACGRWWALEGLPSPARNGESDAAREWIGVKAHFSAVAPRDVVEMYFFPGGYCGLAPVEGGMYNACCLIHQSLMSRLDRSRMADFAAWVRAVARHNPLNARLRGAGQVSSTLATAPAGPARRRGALEGALLAGDAGGFLDPFTGEGISFALHTGRLAAGVLSDALTEENGIADARSADMAIAREYRERRRAVSRSFRVATILRALVRAPDMVQEPAAILLSRFALELVAGTRWQENG